MPTLNIDGHDWHYHVQPSARTDAPPLVLVHGASANLRIWETVMDALTPHFRVYRPDLFGHGLSDKPDDPALYTIPRWSKGLRQLFDHWGLEQSILVGHSLGGMIAQEFSLAWPERVSALGLLCTTPGRLFTTPEARAQEDTLLEFVRTQGIEALWQAGLALNPYADRMAQLPGGHAEQAKEFRRNTAASYINTRLALADKPRHTDRLEELTMPAGVFIGEHDDGMQAASDVLARKLPNATKYVILDAGHSPQLQHPANAAEILRQGLLALLDAVAA